MLRLAQMLPFRLHFEDGTPVSDQLVLAVRRAILAGELSDGDRFPSVRGLSQELRISPTTAHKAVLQLKSEGLLASRPGVGMVVRTDALPSEDDRLRMIAKKLKAFVGEAQALELDLDAVVRALEESWNTSKKTQPEQHLS